MGEFFSNFSLPRREIAEDCTEALKKFTNTVELLNKNKISRANAFDMRMMDEIQQLFKFTNGKLTDSNWREYSIGLDACGKIYGYCVDHLYEEAFKVLGGVHRTVEIEESPENKAISVSKRISRPDATLEENELALNFKDFERCKNTDPYFMAMSKKFDSSNAGTMLLNTSSINSVLDIMLSVDDTVFSNTILPQFAEVNLEGVVRFSLSELIGLDCCEPIERMENTVVKSLEYTSFEEIFERIENTLENDCQVIDDYSSLPDENEPVHIEMPIQRPIDEMVVIDDNFDFFIKNPDGKCFYKDGLLTTPSKKRPVKRKRPQNFVDDSIREAFCILKIDEDDSGKNLMTEGEKNQYLIEKNKNQVDLGYREGRLGELFNRKGKFVGVSYVERAAFPSDPLSLDPLSLDPLNYEENPMASPHISLGYLNMRFLKESIWKQFEGEPSNSFLDILSLLSDEVELNNTEHFSAHTCFVAMLHLANEHNLDLTQTDECDFKITS